MGVGIYLGNPDWEGTWFWLIHQVLDPWVLTVQGVLLSGEKVRVSGGQRVPGAQGCSASVAETTHTQ